MAARFFTELVSFGFYQNFASITFFRIALNSNKSMHSVFSFINRANLRFLLMSILFLKSGSYTYSQVSNTDSLINVFDLIYIEDTNSLKQILNENFDFDIKETRYKLNPFQYSIYWNKKHSFEALYEYCSKHKRYILENKQNLSISILSGNTELTKIILLNQDTLFLRENVNMYLVDFIILYNSFKDTTINDSWRVRTMPDSADLKMLKIFTSQKWFDINKKNAYGKTIGIECRNYPHLIPEIISSGLNLNQKDDFNKGILDYLIEEIIEPIPFYYSDKRKTIVDKINIINLLLNKGAIPNTLFSPWCTIVLQSIENENTELLSVFTSINGNLYDISGCKKEIHEIATNRSFEIRSLIEKIANR